MKMWSIVFIISLFYSIMIISCSEDTVSPEPATRLVVLYHPDNDAILPDSLITFRWGTTSQLADSFKLEITQDTAFIIGILRYGTTTSQYTLNPPGDTNFFYWKVTGYWRSVPDSNVSIIKRFKQR